ncbi:MAG: hypothetical protein RLY86_2194 [Pseudomonadota bacterium]|jgi:bacterioferritin-associated ferredoxin
MYVCVCTAINCKTVRAAARNGAGTVAAVFKSTGKTPQCGRCFTTMREMIETEGPVEAPAMAIAAE